MESQRGLVLFALVLLLGILSYFILQPFLGFLIFGLILAFMSYPLYSWLERYMRAPLAASVVLCAVFLLFVVPAGIVIAGAITQANGAYAFMTSHAQSFDANSVVHSVESWVGIDLGTLFAAILTKVESYAVAALPVILSQAWELAIGLLIMFIVLFYALIDGKSWYKMAIDILPVSAAHKKKINRELTRTTSSLFYGQLLTAVFIGTVCGAIFFLFGIQNPIFWGFVMGIFSFIPLLGAPMIYVPASIILIVDKQWVVGSSIILLCTLVVFFFEYIVRERIVSKGSDIHPLVIIIGALGGVALVGIVGFIIGPLILNLFLLVVRLEGNSVVKN